MPGDDLDICFALCLALVGCAVVFVIVVITIEEEF